LLRNCKSAPAFINLSRISFWPVRAARISVSGNPARQPGDYEQLSDSIPADFSETLELVINDKI